MEKAQKIRYALYSAAVTIAFMAVLDGVVTWLESRGDLDTARAGDSNVLTSDPWMEHEGALIPNPNLPSRMVHHRLRVEKGDAYRVFLLGASFLKGVPFEGPGTIHHHLDARLRAALRGGPSRSPTRR